MFGIDFSDPANSPIVIFIGLLIGQLFLYGRKVKANVQIASRELLGDLMQFGAQFAGAMALMAVAGGLGWKLNSVWQVVTITIVFSMSFDEWFTKIRQAANARFGAAADALLGKLPEDAVVKIPPGQGVPASLEATVISPRATDDELMEELSKRGYTLSEVLRRVHQPIIGKLTPDLDIQKKIEDRTSIPHLSDLEISKALDDLPGTADNSQDN